MCTLVFDYDWGDINVEDSQWSFKRANVTQERREAFESTTNIKYARWCREINQAGGKIIVCYTENGEDIQYGHLQVAQPLHDIIMANL